MTSVNLADLGFQMSFWTSAITPAHLILAKKLFKNKKIENPLYF
jgi:hypothetical protein